MCSFVIIESMKILSITAQKPHSTGSGTYLTELVKSFDLAGHKQAVVAGVYSDDLVSFPEKVQFYPVLFNKDINYPIVGMSDVMPYASTKYSDMSPEMISEFEQHFVAEIGKAIEKLQPDIILCHHLFLLTAIVRKKFPNEKIYAICHGSDLRQMMNCEHLQEFVRPEIQKLDKIFALHDKQKNQIAELYQVNKSKITVIGSGYNDELFNLKGRVEYKKANPVRICYAGKMSSAKGIRELLDAAELLNKSGVKFELTMAGGCQEKDIKILLDNLPCNIKYLGQIPQSELAKLFKKSDIFILPSYYEGLGLVLIEAMACGVIPISTNLPGIEDWINSHVKNSNLRLIPMPEMVGVDVPSDAGRKDFVLNIKKSLEEAISIIEKDEKNTAKPDASDITWQNVSKIITNLY